MPRGDAPADDTLEKALIEIQRLRMETIALRKLVKELHSDAKAAQ
jgi:hypothetical protein